MVTMAGNAIFFDTNILVYASIDESPFYDLARKRIQDFAAKSVDLWISRQVIREFLATLSRPQQFANPVQAKELSKFVDFFMEQFQIVEDGPLVTENLLLLIEKFSIGGKQIHDANIVATMQAYGISNLITHNIKDFERFSSLITILPLSEIV